jgi:hypothetical protein
MRGGALQVRLVRWDYCPLERNEVLAVSVLLPAAMCVGDK